MCFSCKDSPATEKCESDETKNGGDVCKRAFCKDCVPTKLKTCHKCPRRVCSDTSHEFDWFSCPVCGLQLCNSDCMNSVPIAYCDVCKGDEQCCAHLTKNSSS
jgi:hypothetical protein